MATIILVPGLWLDATSWDDVTPALQAAGHDTYPVTLPGLESKDADRAGIGLETHIDAVVAVIDTLEVPVVLVGHSGGGPIVHGATDRRPDRLVRVIYVDSGPGSEGASVNEAIPHDDVDMPLPPWSEFGEEDLRDFTPEGLDAFAARAIPSPSHAATDPLRLHDERRFDVPVTLITSTFPRADLEKMIADEHPFTGDLVRISDVTIVELPTGHWPQFTKPGELAQAIIDAV
jgi:pimeloyl-ACP methyl ester carboxylesterase